MATTGTVFDAIGRLNAPQSSPVHAHYADGRGRHHARRTNPGRLRLRSRRPSMRSGGNASGFPSPHVGVRADETVRVASRCVPARAIAACARTGRVRTRRQRIASTVARRALIHVHAIRAARRVTPRTPGVGGHAVHDSVAPDIVALDAASTAASPAAPSAVPSGGTSVDAHPASAKAPPSTRAESKLGSGAALQYRRFDDRRDRRGSRLPFRVLISTRPRTCVARLHRDRLS